MPIEKSRAHTLSLQAEVEFGASAPPSSSILESLRYYAAHFPDLDAVRDHGRTLSYRNLQNLSDRMAVALLGAGVQPGDTVAVCLPRSQDLIVLMLAILKAGCTVVPLDAASPESRQQSILEDSNASALVAINGKASNLQQFLALEDLLAVCDTFDAPALEQIPYPPSSTAFVFYTSGTSGKPKGVEVPLSAIERLAHEPRFIPMRIGDRYAHISNPAFDAISFDVWVPLLTGGCVVVFSSEDVTDFDGFATVLEQENITTMFMTASLFNLMVDHGTNCFGDLEHLLVGGEQLNPKTIATWYAANPQSPCQIYNVYGPTECATFALCFPIPRSFKGDVVPIGEAIASTVSLLSSDNGVVTNASEVAELYLGGQGVAVGYLNRPEDTQRSFVDLPNKGRWYRTGDRVRRNRYGQIEYVGRIDRQIKIRGFRVEPEEIEQQIQQHQKIRQACIVTQQDPDKPLELHAYIAVDDTFGFEDFEAHLSNRLPDYMRPHKTFCVQTFPLNANGKIDSAALTRMELKPWRRTQETSAPQNAFLKNVISAAEIILKTSGLVGNDTFLAVGGDSLKAISLSNRLHTDFGVRPSPVEILSLSFVELAQKADAQRKHGSLLPAAPTCSRKLHGPATSEQLRLWLHQQKDLAATSYNTPFIFRVAQPLNPEALDKAVRRLVECHPALRTSFHLTAEGVEQRVAAYTSENFHFHGILDEEDFAVLQNNVFIQPFDLERPCLFQVHLAHDTCGSSVLLLNAHHIVVDGWSFNLIFEDLSRNYQQAATNQPFEIEEDHLTPLDFADWQAQFWKTQSYKDQRKDSLSLYKSPEFADCWQPVVTTETADTSAQRAKVRCSAPNPTLHSKVLTLAEQCRATPNQVFLSLFAHALNAEYGRSAFKIASPVANRPIAEFEPTVGMFANTVLIPIVIDAAASAKQNTHTIAHVFQRVLANQDVAFEHVVESLQELDLIAGAPFEFMFALENTRYDTLELQGQKPELSYPLHVEPKCPLFLSVIDDPEGFQLYWEYDLAHFDDTNIERLERAMFATLDQMETTEPVGKFLNEYRLTRPSHAIGTSLPLPHTSIINWFRQQVALSPAAPALAWQQGRISYAELDRLSDQLTGKIHASLQGVPSSCEAVRLALCMDASPEYIVSLLALAKLGITAVPLDLSYPEKLLQDILEQAEPIGLLYKANTSVEQDLMLSGGMPIAVNLEGLHGESSPLPSPLAQSVENPLYTLFTSGSTGRPKGVDVYNSTLCNLLNWQLKEGDLPAGESTMQFSKLAFDVSFQEIFGTLCSGGCFHVIDPLWRQDLQELLAYSRDNQIERIFMPFVALELVAEAALTYETFPYSLKNIVTAGEQLYCTETIRSFFAHLPHATLHNHYGPTETHVVCTHRLRGEPSNWPIRPPIGKPVTNATLLVVGRDDKPSPKGEHGQILIGGPMVHQCYLQNSELNDKRFTLLSFPSGEEERLFYRTGDIGFFDSHGDLHYGGREDQQVKISGHRIELGQVEAALTNHPAIEQAFVVFEQASKQLLAYVKLRGENITSDEISRYLLTQLPAYIRVDAYRRIEDWPRSPSGKVDVKALATCDWSPIKQMQASDAKSNPANRVTDLCAAFEKVVGVTIAAHQTYFDAGCTSMQLMRFQMHLKKEYGIEVSIADLFRHVTPEDLAEHLASKGRQSPEASQKTEAKADEKIAIVGMALRVPGAEDLAQFWSMVKAGESGIVHFDHPEDGFVGARSQMSEMMSFDPAYFGISPRDAALMDPQQRHFLMTCVHALENAGIAPRTNTHSIGLVASCGEPTYFHSVLRSLPSSALPAKFQMALHHEKDFLATKVAFQLDLKGPVMTLQAACGSSLIGVHTAAGMLRNGECDVMLAGGVLIDPEMTQGYKYQPQHIFSKDGNCAPFSNHASGTIGASGVGAMVLKRLGQARADGDRIYAIIEGSAINNDGRAKMNYTSPSVAGQENVIRQALHKAGLTGGQIGYVEAHGTGTQLGDPIEVQALSNAFGEHPETACALSSVKSQIGHMGAGAGALGLIRAALGVYHGYIPPNLGFERANHELNLEEKGFYVPSKCCAWEKNTPRRAGVSSFGIGGTNAHMIIGEAQTALTSRPPVTSCLVLSAHSESALRALAGKIRNYLINKPQNFQKVLQHLQSGRRSHPWRFAAVCASIEEATSSLSKPVSTHVLVAGQPFNVLDAKADDVCQAWLAGRNLVGGSEHVAPPWDLPGYCFDLKEFNLLNKPEKRTEYISDVPERVPEDKWLNQILWQPMSRIPVSLHLTKRKAAVVLFDPAHTTEDLSRLESGYDKVIPVNCGKDYAGVTRDGLSVDPYCKTSLENLLRQLSYLNLDEMDWVHALPLSFERSGTELEPLKQSRKMCLDSLSLILQVNQSIGLKISRICLLSSNALPVNGKVSNPELGLLAGPLVVIPQEFGIETTWLDLEGLVHPLNWSDIAYALTLESSSSQRIAMRNGYIWGSTIQQLPQASQQTVSPVSNRPALYVVAGGNGGIGTQVCKNLLAYPNVQIAILSRNPHVPEELIEHHDRLHLIKSDIGDPSMWDTTIRDLAKIGLPLEGVVHASGVGKGKLIAIRNSAEIYSEMVAKYEGSIFIERLIEVFRPNRVIYCSSMSALLGGAGQLDYAASNALLDSFAHYDNLVAPGTVRTSINWDIWRESGMAVSAAINDPVHQKHLSIGLSNSEGARVFSQVLHTALPQVLVSTCDIDASRVFYRSLLARQDVSTPAEAANFSINLIQSQLETLLLDKLGLNDIDPDDCLYDLGMDSLTLLDVVSLLETNHGISLLLSQIPQDASLEQILKIVDDVAIKTTRSHTADWAANIQINQWRQPSNGEIVCLVHPVGGDVEAYRELTRKLPKTVGVFVIADPYLSDPDLPPITIEDRANLYVDALIEQLGGRRCHLVGWSFGAWVAQEMAAQLSRAHEISGQLTLIDPPAPRSGDQWKQMSEQEVEQIFLNEVSAKWAGAPTSSERMTEAGLKEREVYLQALTRCTKANMTVMAEHVMQPAARWRGNVFIASQVASGMSATQNINSNSRKHWLEFLPDLQNWEIVEGDHYSILKGVHLDHILLTAGLQRDIELA